MPCQLQKAAHLGGGESDEMERTLFVPDLNIVQLQKKGEEKMLFIMKSPQGSSNKCANKQHLRQHDICSSLKQGEFLESTTSLTWHQVAVNVESKTDPKRKDVLLLEATTEKKKKRIAG